MSDLALLSSVMAIHLAAVVSPGPNFLVVTQTAIRDSRAAGFLAASGVALASAIWAVAALVGVSVLFETAAWLYGGLKWLGGAYLVYLGVQSWRRAKVPLAEVDLFTARSSRLRTFRTGFVTNLTNPKAVVFFGSIFAALLSPTLPLWVRAAAVAGVFLNALCWYGFVATVFSVQRVQHLYARAKRHIDRAVGGFFVLLGLRLMLGRPG